MTAFEVSFALQQTRPPILAHWKPKAIHFSYWAYLPSTQEIYERVSSNKWNVWGQSTATNGGCLTRLQAQLFMPYNEQVAHIPDDGVPASIITRHDEFIQLQCTSTPQDNLQEGASNYTNASFPALSASSLAGLGHFLYNVQLYNGTMVTDGS
jgi:hypothetical protein